MLKIGLNTITTLFILFILWVIYLANTGTPSGIFSIVKTTPFADKFGHFFLYGLATLLLNMSFKFKQLPKKYYGLFWGTTIVIVFAIIEEITQAFIPLRTFDLTDLLADGLGILTFNYLTVFIENKIKAQHI